jgi:hypothetical protein
VQTLEDTAARSHQAIVPGHRLLLDRQRHLGLAALELQIDDRLTQVRHQRAQLVGQSPGLEADRRRRRRSAH